MRRTLSIGTECCRTTLLAQMIGWHALQLSKVSFRVSFPISEKSTGSAVDTVTSRGRWYAAPNQGIDAQVSAMVAEKTEMRQRLNDMIAQERAMIVEKRAMVLAFAGDDRPRRYSEKQYALLVQRVAADPRGFQKCIDALEADIRSKDAAVTALQSDIRKKDADIDALQEHLYRSQRTLSAILQLNVNESKTIVPTVGGMVTRVGRHQFDVSVFENCEKLLSKKSLSTQESVALVNQCASGVGKTFAGATFRRGQLNLRNPSVTYEPVCAYLGLNQNFLLTGREERALSKAASASAYEVVKSLVLQRFGFILHGLLQELRTPPGLQEGFKVLDGADGGWVQRMPVPKDCYEFEQDVEHVTDDSAHLLSMLCDMQCIATKRLVVLVVLDEAQKLDQYIPPSALSGGARLALGILRQLQVAVYNKTDGRVLLMPLATGIDAEVSLALGPTEGENKVMGHRDDEALLNPVDFTTLFRNVVADCSVGLPQKEADAFVNVLSAAYYPHVRPMLERPTAAQTHTGGCPDIQQDVAREIVLAAFCEQPMPLTAHFPRSFVAVRACGVHRGVPIPSFFYWRLLHYPLLGSDELPVECVDRNWFEQMGLYQYFEARCFSILGYFLRVFGPIQTDSFRASLKAPLDKWMPELFTVSKYMHLRDAHSHINPFSTPPHKGHACVGDWPLVPEYVKALLCALAATATAPPHARSTAMPQGVWVMCGGTAPIDYILTVVYPAVGGTVRVALRFADAKHTTMEAATKGLHGSANAKAEQLHEAIARRLAADRVFGALHVAVDAFHPTHTMICHNEDDDSSLSPSTFVWRPWSNILFCRS